MAAITWGKQSGPHEMSLLLQVAAMPSKMLAVIWGVIWFVMITTACGEFLSLRRMLID